MAAKRSKPGRKPYKQMVKNFYRDAMCDEYRSGAPLTIDVAGNKFFINLGSIPGTYISLTTPPAASAGEAWKMAWWAITGGTEG